MTPYGLCGRGTSVLAALAFDVIAVDRGTRRVHESCRIRPSTERLQDSLGGEQVVLHVLVEPARPRGANAGLSCEVEHDVDPVEEPVEVDVEQVAFHEPVAGSAFEFVDVGPFDTDVS